MKDAHGVRHTVRTLYVLIIHMNKKLIAGFIISIATIPLAASALTFDEIQAKIKELLSQVSSLQQQMKDMRQDPSVRPDQSTSVSELPRVCKMSLGRALSAGIRNDDVRGLQEFLVSEGYLNAEATGYFGSQTRAALGKWQIENDVVASADARAGWGVAGPKTRSAIMRWCQNPKSNNAFSAKPQSGPAPLAVTFTARPTAGSGYTYSIDFGDGQSGSMSISPGSIDCAISPPGAQCSNWYDASHTYTVNGTYTAVLYQNHPGGCGPNADPRCLGAPAMHSAIGRVQIRVGDQPVGCTKEYRPVCGSKPIVCITTPCNPIQQTYSNRCMMDADNATFVHEGVCRDDNGNRPPSISSFSGPTSLALNAVGTWSITATDPENGNLSYSIQWGDEWASRDAAMTSFPPSNSIQQQTTFTHSYTYPGSYTVRITVRDEAGKEAKATATVQVGTTTYCTMEYAPVCGRPPCPGDPNLCGITAPQTYSNRCHMNAAGATFIYGGVCQ